MQSADFLTGKVEKNAVIPVADFCLFVKHFCLLIYLLLWPLFKYCTVGLYGVNNCGPVCYHSVLCMG